MSQREAAKGKAPTAATVEASSANNQSAKEIAMTDSIVSVREDQIQAIVGELVSEDGRIYTTSMQVAGHFGKQHKHVLEKISGLIGETPVEFNRPNFRPVEFVDAKGEKRPAYRMTRDGFTLLAMGFTGKKALQFKLAYIGAFNKMEEALAKQQGLIPYSVAPGQTLSAEEAQSLRDLLENFAQSMPRDLQAQIMRQGWSKLKAHFKTDYRHIPAARYTEAVSILSRHIAQWAPADPKKKGALDVSDAPAMMHAREVAQQYFDDYRDAVQSGKERPHMGEIPPEVLEGLIAEAVMRHRLMVHFDRSTGKPVARLMNPNAVMVNFRDDNYQHIAEFIPMERIPQMMAALGERVETHFSAFKDYLARTQGRALPA